MRAMIVDRSGSLAGVLEPFLRSHGYSAIESVRDARAVAKGSLRDGAFDLLVASGAALRGVEALAAAAPRVVILLHERDASGGCDESVRSALEAVHGEGAGARLPASPGTPPIEALAGDIAWCGGTRLLELVSFAEGSGALLVEADEAAGCVEVSGGELVSASFGTLAGEDALFAIAALERGRFRFVPGAVSSATTLSRSTEALLVEALRRAERSPAPGEHEREPTRRLAGAARESDVEERKKTEAS